MLKRSSLLVYAFGLITFTFVSCGPVESPVDADDASFGAKPTTKGGKGGSGGGGKKNTDTAQTISGTGVVHAMTDSFGNTFWGIELADGTRYEVVNFPSGAFADGQTVNFSAYIMSGYITTNNYGQAILLSAITAA